MIARHPPTDIRDVRFVQAAPADVERGLVGFVSFTLGPLRIGGVTVRRLADSRRLALSFPCRRDAHGGRHFVVRPIGDRERRAVEFEVLRALGLTEAAAP